MLLEIHAVAFSELDWPEFVILGLDLILFTFGIGSMIFSWRRLSRQIGHGITFACGGLALLALVHFVETGSDLTGLLTTAPNEIIHRILVITGFSWLMLGLARVGHDMVLERSQKDDLIADLKELEDQLRQQAFHDPLTGLANRARFVDRLEHALVRSKRTGEQVAVLFVDLDEFKAVNDSYGHDVGDALIGAVGERLAAVTRAGDTIARLGGDEFALVLDGTVSQESAEATALRLLELLRVPFSVRGLELSASASVGVAMSVAEETGGELLRRADLAMYTSKADGKNRSTTFDHGIQAAMGVRLELMNELQGAVQRGEFVLHYQPTIDIASGAINGVEALVRWQHPSRGLVQPVAFIPLAEQSGVIIELGNWVLIEACRQLAEWHRGGNSNIDIAVNVAARQLQQADFAETVRQTLNRFGLSGNCLIIEITESATMRDVPTTVRVLTQLKELGVRLAIDDFGTGYSSLSHLRQFPFDLLKIDKSFVDTVQTSSSQLTTAIVGIAKGLDLEIVAEGVEELGQLAMLRSLNCDSAQGFLISRPLPAADMTVLLGRKTRADAA